MTVPLLGDSQESSITARDMGADDGHVWLIVDLSGGSIFYSLHHLAARHLGHELARWASSLEQFGEAGAGESKRIGFALSGYGAGATVKACRDPREGIELHVNSANALATYSLDTAGARSLGVVLVGAADDAERFARGMVNL